MTIHNNERTKLAKQYLAQYFPNMDKNTRKIVVELAVHHFTGNYSPVKVEQDDRGAIGSGTTFEEFVIYLGELRGNEEPMGVDHAWLGSIIAKTGM
ncbi:MAG TPA: hypothetical protein DCX25_02595 [Candidatus Pacebacteria bacterium]|nr:MAG: hypothetical protein UX00_C0004G0057 [Microgenomates group bacterium GW2011_GWB1_45_17]KKU23945.1 MAG: hypothetical protein UX35_C0003G0081 [Microgenomates group bacterium GW2011_GWA1_46_15]KKU24662.1 MAG: hypothetical protein UX36_C0001G0279 [Microgenomates group bacterium GW2011_GWC1_46_15]HAV15193.1 hypothetical protein [Candidatus Paceibacterota bacterium]HCR11096.1 hypothetical protein [Candidatus Paceibacterota bacterium]